MKFDYGPWEYVRASKRGEYYLKSPLLLPRKIVLICFSVKISIVSCSWWYLNLCQENCSLTLLSASTLFTKIIVCSSFALWSIFDSNCRNNWSSLWTIFPFRIGESRYFLKTMSLRNARLHSSSLRCPTHWNNIPWFGTISYGLTNGLNGCQIFEECTIIKRTVVSRRKLLVCLNYVFSSQLTRTSNNPQGNFTDHMWITQLKSKQCFTWTNPKRVNNV